MPDTSAFPEWLVDVNEAQLPEGRQDQIFFYLFHFAECDHIPARIVKAHDGDAVVGAAYAVVKNSFYRRGRCATWKEALRISAAPAPRPPRAPPPDSAE